RERFTEARARFERDGSHREVGPEMAMEFEAIARDYADDPVAPYALLYAGMSSVRAGDAEQALTTLEAVLGRADTSEAVRGRAQLYRGLALIAADRAAEAADP